MALLAGYRGRPAADIEAVLDAAEAVARYAEANAGRLIELDVNPLIAGRSGAVAADALIRLTAIHKRITAKACKINELRVYQVDTTTEAR